MLAGTVATALLFAGRQGGAYSYVVGGVFGLSSLGMIATSMLSGAGRRGRIDVAGARRAYRAALARTREQIRANMAAQRSAVLYRHPAPSVLISMVDSFRLWERRPGDADFGAVRIGLGPQELTTPLVPGTGTGEEPDPACAADLRRMLDTYAIVDDLPVAIAITEFAHVYADDPGIVRAILAQLAFAHAPGDLVIAVCAEDVEEWDFVKWLPHAQHPRIRDQAGPLRLISDRLGEVETLLGDVIDRRPAASRTPSVERTDPLVIVVIDGGDRTGARRLASSAGPSGCCVIDINGPDRSEDPPDRTAITLSVTPDGRLIADGRDVGTADALSIAESVALARALAPLRITGDAATAPAEANRSITLDGLLGLSRIDAESVREIRTRRAPDDRLRVPIGVRSDGHPLLLDLKEAARDGMGPHGLLIGATGSGKSELLRTLVLGLAASHDPETLNFVLIDFKGGATFASFDRLPHTAAVITNLVDELPLVDRMADALNGELMRRQELLRKAGNRASLHDYELARQADPTLAPIPVLLIICDEFSELLSAKPDFIDLFVAIGRLGRSLGVHLLLASQRLDEGRLRGLDTHLSYRIGLRTFSALESRAVLGVADAFELPRSPGHGYLRAGTEPLARFKAAYASGAYQHTVAPAPRGSAPQTWDLTPFIGTGTAVHDAPAPASSAVLLDVMTDALAGLGPAAHRVWLPPLADAEPLDALLGTLVRHPVRGLTTADQRVHGHLRTPIAIVDRPFEQRRDPLWLTLDAGAGHVAIVGAPQSGKSTALRTLICGLALTHTPGEVSFYCLDFGGGALGALRDLPHVGAVVGRHATEAVRRTVGEVAALLAARERRFATDGVDSIVKARAAGLDPYGDIFLVVDGWASAHSEFEDLEPTITGIAARGLSYGVHVVVSAARWADLRPALRDQLGSRLELRLGDPSDSQIGRKAAMSVPPGAPGRGITSDERHLLMLAPQAGTGTTDDLVKAIAASWTGTRVPAVRQLPALVPFGELPPITPGGSPTLVLPVGIAETDLAPVCLDFAEDPHLLIFGESRSGKSSVLRAVAAALIAGNAPEQARLVVLDYRRSMAGDLDGDHVIGYATAAGPAMTLLSSVAEYMQRRLPGPDVTPQELRTGSWRTGPECFVLVDDYDLVTGGGTNPLTPLLEFLPQARDIGLHLIIARRSGGAARALFEPVLARLRELATPGLILSGDSEEGALIGSVRPRQLPPGRGTLVTRRDGARLIQLGYLERDPAD